MAKEVAWRKCESKPPHLVTDKKKKTNKKTRKAKLA
jgi:hypothetical protein